MPSSRNTTWLVGAAIGVLLLISEQSMAQNSIQNWNVGGPASWNDDANWEHATDPTFSGIPLADFDDSANIGNGGTAVVDESVQDYINLSIPNGTLDIQQGGVTKNTGNTSVGGGGILRISGNGSFETGDLRNGGLLELVGNDVSIRARGDFTNTGTLTFDITAAGNPVINVGGAATFRGTVAPNFSGVSLALGDSFQFMAGASSVTDGGVKFELPETVTLGRGLSPILATTNRTAAVAISNVPVLSLDRRTGAVVIENVVGDPVMITGYSILSISSGLLKPQDWSSLADQQVADWAEANPREQALAELNLQSSLSLEVGSPLVLGNAYNAARGVHPTDEDVTFRYSTPDDQIVDGFVEFTGPANDLVLRVDPDTGEGALQNLSQFTDPFDITVYSVFSDSGALSVAGWTSLEDAGTAGWVEANPRADALAELNLTGSQLFGNGQSISLGNLFTPGSTRDLVFEFGTVDGQFRFGTVEYGEVGGIIVVPGDCNGDGAVDALDLACVATIEERDIVLAALNTLPGDLNGNGDVAFADFLVLSASFGNATKTLYTEGNIDLMNGVAFADFLVLSANFGTTPAAGATAAAVPEPSSLLLVSLGALYLLGRRRHRIR